MMSGPDGMYPTFDATPVIDTVTNPSIAETSDKFVAILIIVKNLESRIYDLEKKKSI